MSYYKAFFLVSALCVLTCSCLQDFSIPTTAYIDIQEGEGNLKIRKKAEEYVYLVLDSHDFKEITATLSSDDPLANIRFT